MPAATPASRPGFLFLVCPDVQLLRDHVEELVGRFPAKAASYDRFCYWGDEPPPDSFWENLSLTDLFGSQRLLLVRMANHWQAPIWHKLDKALARPLSGSWPIFCLEADWEKGKPKLPLFISKLHSLAFAEKKGWIWRNPGLTERNLRAYIERQAASRGLAFDPQLLARFADSVPPRAEIVLNELDKLSLLTAGSGDGRITADMLGTADWSPDANLFSCAEALLRGDEQATWREYSRVDDADKAVFPMLGILALNFRRLWQSMAGEPVRFFGSTATMMPALARRLGAAGLSKAMGLILDTEVGIKSGKYSPQSQGLEFLLSSLLPLCKGR